jgi:hypothetical protein
MWHNDVVASLAGMEVRGTSIQAPTTKIKLD